MDSREGQLLTDEQLEEYFRHLLGLVDQVPGSIVECGVGHGYSLSILAKFSKDRVVWGYDTFKGLPEPGPEDESPFRKPRGRGSFAASTDEVLERVGSMVLLEPLLLGEKPYCCPAQIALLHLDLDLYASYKAAIADFVPLLSPGGIVAFDEYLDKGWPGCRKAVDEAGLSPIRGYLFKDGKARAYWVKP